MNSFPVLLTIGLLLAGTAQSQTRPATAPVTTTANQSATTPTTATSTATTRPATRPTTTSASSTTASPNRRQALYDQYHGYNRKPGSPAPATPAERRVSRPAAEPARPVSTAGTESVARTEQPVSSDVGNARVRIGVRGGITRLVYLEKLVGAEPTSGFVGGFVLNVGSGALSFQPELNYARYADKATIGRGSPSEITLTEAVDRIEVPLLLKFASGSANSSRFFLNVGPYGAYTSSASINGQNVSLSNAGGRLSFGAAAGAGAALKAGPGHAIIELRGLYQLGTTDNSLSTDSRTINAQATIGYMLPLGGR